MDVRLAPTGADRVIIGKEQQTYGDNSDYGKKL